MNMCLRACQCEERAAAGLLHATKIRSPVCVCVCQWVGADHCPLCAAPAMETRVESLLKCHPKLEGPPPVRSLTRHWVKDIKAEGQREGKPRRKRARRCPLAQCGDLCCQTSRLFPSIPQLQEILTRHRQKCCGRDRNRTAEDEHNLWGKRPREVLNKVWKRFSRKSYKRGF